jgi:hypothetical protein
VTRTTAFRIGFLALTLAAVAAVLAVDGGAVAAATARLPPWALLGSAGCVVGQLLVVSMAWRAVLADGGWRLDVRAAVRVFLVGQLGKYLPGGIWNVVTQAELAADRGVPRLWTVSASAVSLGISVAVGGILAVPALLALSVPGVPVAVVGLVPLGLAAFHPRLLNPLLGLGARLLRRPAPRPLSARGVTAALGWTLLSWLLLAGHQLVLLAGIGAPLDATTLLVAGCGYALAWVIGFLVLFAPAGAGAREVTLVAVLLAVVPRPEALVVALASRLVLTVADVAAAGLALAAGRGRRSQPAPATDR